MIIDEAHTAIGNESAKDIVAALSTEADIQQAMAQADAEGYEDQMDALMAYMQTQRQQMSHISYFAFTATPKDKTYALFGKKTTEGYVAHDYYTMKQAIDEKFILDVLRNYTTYKTMFEYIEKNTAHPTMAMSVFPAEFQEISVSFSVTDHDYRFSLDFPAPDCMEKFDFLRIFIVKFIFPVFFSVDQNRDRKSVV